MDNHRLVKVAQSLGSPPSRRHVLRGLAGLGITLGTSSLPEGIDAKKKKKKKGKNGKKGKKKDKTTTTPPPPLPPSTCTPDCAGKPCGADDGCGGTCGCAAGSVCHEGVCRTCTVTCEGNGTACGDTLKTALAAGGTVYACPGRYVGNFELFAANTVLVGAGAGDDPASSTILDANQSGRVVLVKILSTAALHTLRVTGGALPGGNGGGGIHNNGKLTLTDCTVSKNAAGRGAGIYQASTRELRLNNCAITENTSTGDGGGINANAGPVAINGGVISGNKAFNGGGIINVGSTMTIAGAVIKGNRARGGGAGLFNQETTTFDSASRVTGNFAEGGGGIFLAAGGTVTLNGATVATNVPDNCSPEGGVAGCSG